jgi:hypothetical protein
VSASSLTRLEAATTLEEIYLTLSPEPLMTEMEMKAFYRDEVNAVRGGDKIKRLKLGLQRASQGNQYYKACLMGHQGVGKSTELNRLILDNKVSNKYKPIRFSILTDLDPINFNALDIILFILIEIVEKTEKVTGTSPDDSLLEALLNWFATEKVTRKENQETSMKLEAGGGVKDDSLWSKVLGLFANLKGEFRFASSREKEVIQYRFSKLNDLLKIANKLLNECNTKLQQSRGLEWLIIGENFDKAGVSTEAIRDLFINYSNLLKDLQIHQIFTLPIGLYNSAQAIRLCFTPENSLIVPDTAIFKKNTNFSPHREGRNAIEQVLRVRVNFNLFESEQIPRIITASGGNIRDLFYIVNLAADEALINNRNAIVKRDVTIATNNLRTEYERRLGTSRYDLAQIPYPQKVDRLLAIYNCTKEAEVPDEVLYALLDCRAVQEVDQGEGERCFMVHPLVVDILHAQGHINANGGTLGGTSS